MRQTRYFLHIIVIVTALPIIVACGGAQKNYLSEHGADVTNEGEESASDNTSPTDVSDGGEKKDIKTAGSSGSSLNRARLDLPWPDLSKPLPKTGGGELDAAVIVGIERYEHVPGIPGAKANAKAWYDYLVNTMGTPAERVKLIPQNLATREEMLRSIEGAANMSQTGGRIWFIFIGHGAPTEGDGLMLGVDVRQTADSLESRGLKQGDALAVLNQSKAQPVMVIDACFSGRTTSGDPVVEGLQPVRNVKLPPSGKSIVMTAAAGDQYAGQLPGASKPAFSYLALGAVRGWGDTNNDGKVSAEEVVNYSRNTMGALVFGRKQTPQIDGDNASAVLGISSEEGPDVSKLAKLLSDSEEQMFNKDGLMLGDLPMLNLQDLDRGAVNADVNLEALSIEDMNNREKAFIALQNAKEKVEKARAAQQNDHTGEKQRKAWCELANLPDPNPYRNEAESACSQATSYVQQRQLLVSAMNRDWLKVKHMMTLRSYGLEDKSRVMRAFVKAYEVLTEQTPVVVAAHSYILMSKGEIPSIDDVWNSFETKAISGVDWDAFNGKTPEKQGNDNSKIQLSSETQLNENNNSKNDVKRPTVIEGRKKRIIGHGTLWPGVLLLGFGGLSTSLAAQHGTNCTSYGDPSCDASRTWSGLMWGGYGAGVAMVSTGLVFLITGIKEKDVPRGRISLAPLVNRDNLVFTISGEW